jgi:hypothetical protein
MGRNDGASGGQNAGQTPQAPKPTGTKPTKK